MSLLKQIIEKQQDKINSLKNTVLAQGVKKETEKAILLDLFNVKEMESFDLWIPKSAIESRNENEFVLTEWFFKKNGAKFLSTVKF